MPRNKRYHPNQRSSSSTLQFADLPSAPALRFPDSVVMLIFSNNSKLPAGFGVALMGLTPFKGFAAVDDASRNLHPLCPNCLKVDGRLYSVAFSGRMKTLKYRCAECEHCWEVVELQRRTDQGQ